MATQKKTKPVRHVALAYPVSVPWMALFMRGVTDYAEQRGGWLLTASPPALSWAGEEPLALDSLRGWPGDGVIAAIASREELRAAKGLGKPLVNMAATLCEAGFPRVMPDHVGMGRLAAEHLLDRGLRRLAYYGVEGIWFSQQRCAGFVERARQASVACDVLELPRHPDTRQTWSQRLAPLTRWLQQLRPPVGLLAMQDYRARAVMDECQRLGLDIPHDIAVLGMEDDPTVCDFCRPTLSSVSRNGWRLGYETAALLDRLMDGRSPPPHDILIPSDGVVARQSTDTVAVEDPHVAAAVHFIHDHIAEPFGVERVVRATSISRRQLEVRFRRVLGCTLHDYICRERIERAKRLLGGAERIKLQQVAAACGLITAERLQLVFKRVTGQTPLQYRAAEVAKTPARPREGLNRPAKDHAG
jgi:LacI family transcriptional regulator